MESVLLVHEKLEFFGLLFFQKMIKSGFLDKVQSFLDDFMVILEFLRRKMELRLHFPQKFYSKQENTFTFRIRNLKKVPPLFPEVFGVFTS